MGRALFSLVFLFLTACDGSQDPKVLTISVQKQDFQVTIPATGELEASHSTSVIVPTSLHGPQSLAWIQDNFTQVKAGEVIARLDPRLEKYRLKMEQFAYQKLALDLDIQSKKDKTASDDLTLDSGVTDKELSLAKRFFVDDQRVYSKIDIIDQMRNQGYLNARKHYFDWSLAQHDSQAQAEQTLLILKQRSYKDKITGYQQNLAHMEIVAPYDGLFVYRAGWDGENPRVGDMLWSGMELGILPDTTKMQARLYVLESEAAGLAVGKPVKVTLDAYPDKAFTGKVTQVDSLAKPKDNNSPVNYFGIVVALDTTVPELMKPGRQVSAVIDIMSEQQQMSVPNQALFHQDSHYWVYVKSGHRFHQQLVQIGVRSLNRTQILKGLKSGDLVALSKPILSKPDTLSKLSNSAEPV